MDYFRPYRLVKASPRPLRRRQINLPTIRPSFHFHYSLAVLLISAGIFVLTTKVLGPLWGMYADAAQQVPVVRPVAQDFGEFSFYELEKYQSAEESASLPRQETAGKEPAAEFFYLSIPKLGIKSAQVKTNATDLAPDDYIGHYQGSALPNGRDVGNAFLYCHSVLPEYFNPEDYRTICSTLPNLERDDEFFIDYNNHRYDYLVRKTLTFDPEDLNPLADYYPLYLNKSTVSIMTCVPPGRMDYRLVVVGELIR